MAIYGDLLEEQVLNEAMFNLSAEGKACKDKLKIEFKRIKNQNTTFGDRIAMVNSAPSNKLIAQTDKAIASVFPIFHRNTMSISTVTTTVSYGNNVAVGASMDSTTYLSTIVAIKGKNTYVFPVEYIMGYPRLDVGFSEYDEKVIPVDVSKAVIQQFGPIADIDIGRSVMGKGKISFSRIHNSPSPVEIRNKVDKFIDQMNLSHRNLYFKRTAHNNITISKLKK